jgi:hypothetical protein
MGSSDCADDPKWSGRNEHPRGPRASQGSQRRDVTRAAWMKEF